MTNGLPRFVQVAVQVIVLSTTPSNNGLTNAIVFLILKSFAPGNDPWEGSETSEARGWLPR